MLAEPALPVQAMHTVLSLGHQLSVLLSPVHSQGGPWYILLPAILLMGLPCGSDSKESACNAGDLGLERSSGEGNGYPLQYSGLENSMDRGSWWATVHGVGKIWTRLSKYNTFTFHTINRKASLFLPHFPHLQLRVQALEF